MAGDIGRMKSSELHIGKKFIGICNNTVLRDSTSVAARPSTTIRVKQ
jgi:hypothetical protein